MNTLDAPVLITLAFIAANLPFLTERLFFTIALKTKKFGWRLLELCVIYLIVGGIALLLEYRSTPLYKQGWEFYVITFCLFLILSYPGFVYRYLWRVKT